MYPIRFEPIYRDYVWGGDRIAQKFDRKIQMPRVAESWEVSDRDDGMSVVMNGPWKGKTLHQLVIELGEDLLGVGQKVERFPLLLKIIDAKENLSLQVHPDETTAIPLKGEPKNEMWVMLEPGTVYAGLQKEVTQEQLSQAIQSKQPLEKIQEWIQKFDLKKGDVVYIPGGRVHAICAGSLIYEVQQNSNTTYRLYDWGRSSRELHVKEGLAAIDWNDRAEAKVSPHHLSSDFHHQWVILLATPHFVVDRIDVFDHFHVAAIPKTFQIFYCLEGKGELTANGHQEPLEPGVTYLIPASCKGIEVRGRCQLLRARMP